MSESQPVRRVSRQRPIAKALPRITGKQLAWVEAYVGEARFNATKAARMVGYRDANQSGYLNRMNSDVRAHVDAWLEGRALGAHEVLAEIQDVAMAEWRDLLEIRVDPKTGETIEVKLLLGDKLKALELLGKHHRLFTENVAISGGIRREVVIKRPAAPSRPLTESPADE